MINWFLCWLMWIAPSPKPQPREKLPPLYFTGAPHECANATGGIRCDICFGPIGFNRSPSTSCVINEEAHGLEISDGW